MTVERGLRVVSAGPGHTIQDAGRHGSLRYGVTPAGPMDALAHATANRALGNPPGSSAIEISVGGIELTAQNAAVTLAIAGGGFSINHDGQSLPKAVRLTLEPGATLTIRAGAQGCWCYLAVAGGFDVPRVLGSSATHTRSGLGGVEGRTLRAGDRLAVEGLRDDAEPTAEIVAPWLERAPGTIRVVPGPQADYFTADEIAAFLAGPWTVSAKGDRMACFLDGRPLRHAKGYNIVSDGIALGAIQVPGEGFPIVLMADRQSTGGYPKIATVIGPDLGALAQARPGTRIAFESVTIAAAVEARRQQAATLAGAIRLEPLVRTRFSPEFLLGVNLIDGVVSAYAVQV